MLLECRVFVGNMLSLSLQIAPFRKQDVYRATSFP